MKIDKDFQKVLGTLAPNLASQLRYNSFICSLDVSCIS